jgi:hypothetical protein
MHPERNSIDVLKDDGIFFDTQFKLEEPDTFSDQTYVKNDNIMVLGQYHIHIINLDSMAHSLYNLVGYNFVK